MVCGGGTRGVAARVVVWCVMMGCPDDMGGGGRCRRQMCVRSGVGGVWGVSVVGSPSLPR